MHLVPIDTMSFEWGVANFIAVSALTFKVYEAYKDAPDDYRHISISEDVLSLRALLDKVAHHFKATPVGSDDRPNGQKILKGCQGVLEGLYSLSEKYKRLVSTNKRLASTNKWLVLATVKLGKEDLVTLQERLRSNVVRLKGFIRKYVLLFLVWLHYPNPQRSCV